MIEVGEWLNGSAAPAAGKQPACGLFIKDSDKPLPLRSREVSAAVYAEHGICEVSEELAYLSDQDCTVRFVFPVPPRSAVYKFAAKIGDRTVVTEVKRKDQAQEEFDSAVRQGHTAVHMQKQQGASLYSVEIGNLAAMEEAIITFSYVRILNSVAGAVEFEHQATWVPPYLTAGETHGQGRPLPAVAESNPVFTDKVSYKLSYNIKVQSSRGFRSIESPSLVVVTEEGPCQRIITLAESVVDPSRDLTLLVELPPLAEDKGRTGQLLLQEVQRGGKSKTVALASFVPRLPQPAPSAAAPREIIFVIDGSGSMGGSPIQQALEAALFFVKDLPAAGSTAFNAAMFGSHYATLWNACKPYTEATQQQAVQWLQQQCHANWGGTEVLKVLQALYENMPLAAGTTRQIIFLTDGGVSSGEEQRIFSLLEGKAGSQAARSAAARTTVFSLGIGHGVHRGLVEGVAKKTGGLAQFVVDGEPIGKKAGLLKRCALAAGGGCLSRPRLVARSCLVKPAPNVLPPRLFPDEPLHVLVEVVKSDPGAALGLTADVAGPGSSPYSIDLPLDSALRVPGEAFAVLHAMASIGSLLDGTSPLHCSSDGTPHAKQPAERQVEDAVVLLAEQEGLVTPHTSAVGVLLQANPLDPEAVQRVEVPLQVPAGRALWQRQQQQQMAPGAAYGGGRGSGAVSVMCLRMVQPAAPSITPFGAALASCKPAVLFGASAAAAPASSPAFGFGYSAFPAAQSSGGPNFSAAGGAGYAGGQQQQHLGGVTHTTDMMECDEDQPVFQKPMKKKQASLFSTVAGNIFGRLTESSAARSRGQQHESLFEADAPLCRTVKVAQQPAKPGGGFASGPAPAAIQCMADGVYRSSQSHFMKEELAVDLLGSEGGQQLQQHSSIAVQEQGRKAADHMGASLSPLEVLSLLNMKRTLQGSIPATQEVLEALAGQAWQQQQQQGPLSLAEFAAALRAPAARPSALVSDDAWVTLLALAYLRKHLASEQHVWSGLEAKALEWLAGAWPSELGRSVGSLVLVAIKLV